MSIKRKIWSLPIISTIIFGIGVAVSAGFANRALDSIVTTARVDYPALSLSKALTTDLKGITDGLRDAVSEGDKERISQVDEEANKVRARLTEIGKLPGLGSAANRLTGEFNDYYAPAVSAARIMLELEEGDPQTTVERMQNALTVLDADVARFNEHAQQQFQRGVAESSSNVRFVLSITIITALIVILAMTSVSWFVIRTIWQQLGGEPEYAREITRKVAAGDLSMDIRVEEGDRHSLLAALQEMRMRLAAMVADIQTSAGTIATASSEIASGSADLASRTEFQAERLQSTGRAMESLTDTVRNNAAHASEANDLVVSATGIATRGGEVVENVVATMSAINASASKIVDIITVIDGIAFQTNILALNAAVEAARAGEQGRGFAVVAGEVRTLAQRSAAAAKEIKELINDSVARVQAGTALVDEAGATMGQILVSVRKVQDIMTQVTAASQRQSDGIAQIGHAIDGIDQMTQQNSALVEEATAATTSLTDQMSQLTVALAQFKLKKISASSQRTQVPIVCHPALG